MQISIWYAIVIMCLCGMLSAYVYKKFDSYFNKPIVYPTTQKECPTTEEEFINFIDVADRCVLFTFNKKFSKDKDIVVKVIKSKEIPLGYYWIKGDELNNNYGICSFTFNNKIYMFGAAFRLAGQVDDEYVKFLEEKGNL